MTSIRWEHCNTRRLSVQGAIAWHGGIGKYFIERYGAGILNTVAYCGGKKTDFFFDKKQHEQFNEKLDHHLENREFVLSMIPEAIQWLEKKQEFIQELVEKAENLSNEELAELFSQISYHHAHFYPRKWMAYRICGRMDLKVEKMLRDIGWTQEQIEEFLRIISVPLQPNYVVQERIDLLQIALQELDSEQRTLKLQEHTTKYRHIPLFDIDHCPYTFDYFQQELQKIRDPQEELKNIKERFRKRREKFARIINELPVQQQLRDMVMMIKDATYFRDYADTLRQKMNYSLRSLYQVIGERIGLDGEKITLLTNEEINQCLLLDITFDANEVVKRQEAFLLIQKQEEITIFSGKEAAQKAEELDLLKTLKGSLQLQGRTAHPGTLQGRVKVIYTNKDLHKIEEGDIMVTTMTRQDFAPYLRRIKALITEEGGVACHAAIMARELELPCIVGASGATQVLNDGDIVHLNGITGEINKINSPQ